MGLAASGYEDTVCYDFDIAVEQFHAWVETREQATKSVPAPPAPKKPMKEEPLYRTLAALLGLDVQAQEAPLSAEQEALVQALAAGEVDVATFVPTKDP